MGTSAWAEKEWQLAWADYFEDASKYTTNMSWSSTNNCTISQANRPDGVSGKYYYAYDNGGNGRVWTFTIGNAYEADSKSWSQYTFDADEAYKLEFDMAFRSDRFNNSSGSDQLFTIPNLVNMTLPKAGTTATFKAINAYAAGSITAGQELFTITAVYDYSSTGNVFANHFYHFVVEGRATGTTLSVYGPYTEGATPVAAVYSAKLSDSKIDVATLTGTLQRYYSSYGLDNVVLYKEVEAGTVEVPTAAITAVDGANRTVTFSCTTDGVTFSYSTDGGSNWTTADYVIINTDTDIIVKATKGVNSNQSATLSFKAGNVLKLNNPTVTKTAYSSGNFTVSVSHSQSNLEVVPSSPAVKYTINDGDTQTYTTPIALAEGKTLKVWIENTGYTSSDEITCATEARPNFANMAQSWTQNYKTVVTGTTGACSVILSETSGGDFVVGTTPYYNITGYNNSGAVDVDLNTNVGLAVATNFSLRNNSNNSGILQNGTDRNIGIQNLKVGDYIVITTNGNALDATSGVTLKNGMSTSSEYIFQADATEAEILFYHGTYAYVQTITVYSTTVSATVGAKGYSTLTSDYSLNFTGKSIKAYIVKSTDGSALTLTQVNKVVKNTPLLLYSATNSDSQDIPVIADSEATDDLTGNKLVAGDGAAHTWTANTNEHYVLYTGGATPGFYQALNSNVAVGKAYLDLTGLSATARSFDLNLGDDVTGISEKVTVNSEKFATATYNLNGQRVAQPTKGLYIVNGKKVVIK